MKILCSCGNIFEVTTDNFAHETEVTKRNMGAEVVHHFIFEDSCENQDCDKQIQIELQIAEYPVGCISHDEMITESEGKLHDWDPSDFIPPLQ